MADCEFSQHQGPMQPAEWVLDEPEFKTCGCPGKSRGFCAVCFERRFNGRTKRCLTCGVTQVPQWRDVERVVRLP